MSERARESADPTPRKRSWSVVLGAAIGVALGILVSVTAAVPFAPEAGLILGGLVGWFVPALRHGPAPR